MLMKTENNDGLLSDYIDTPQKELELLNKVKNFYPLLNKLYDNSIYEISNILKDDALYLMGKKDELESKGINLKIAFKCKKAEFKITSEFTSDYKICTKIRMNNKALKDNEFEKLLKTNEQFLFIQDSWQIIDDIKSFEKYHNKIFTLKQFIHEFKEYPKTSINFNDTISVPLCNDPIFKPHQLQAINYISNSLANGRNILLADDMGLGKTATAIGVLKTIGGNKPNLIICPKTVQENWASEIKKFSNLKCEILTNDTKITNNKTYIATYSKIANNKDVYSKIKWNTVLIDEAQQIKNADTKTSESVCSLKSEHRLAMTGTPIENSANDLYCIMYFVNPLILGTRKDFAEIISNVTYQELIDILKPFIIRRLKSDSSIGLNLPEKNEHIIHCDMNENQIALYNNFINLSKTEKKFTSLNILKFMTKLKMVCSYPQYYVKTLHSEKLNKLKELIINSGYKPFVIFTQYKDCANNLLDELNKVYYNKGALINGDLSAKKRFAIAENFQKGNYSFIVVTLKAGNSGITLTNACNLVHYDRWWNPAVENQASDRIYRIGQTNEVNIYKFVCDGTIEERIDDLLNQKQNLFNNIVNEFVKHQDELFYKI